MLTNLPPFGLSLSKGSRRPFDKLRTGFDRLSPNGVMNFGTFI